jgi:uncharacterized membrane protein YgcG
MVRQARTYFAGAVSGVTLIGIAIAVFVVLVSAQVFHEWPIAALGFGHDDSAVAPAKSLGGEGAQTANAAPTTVTRKVAAPVKPAPTTVTPAPTPQGKQQRHKRPEDSAAKAEDVTGAAPVVEEAPATITESPTTSSSSSQASSPASNSSSSQSSSQSSSSSDNSSSSSGGNSSSSSSGGNSGGGAPATGSSSSGGSSTGGGQTSGTPPVTETVETVTTPPANVAAGVNETVNNVDEQVLGGALKETGVTEVTEGLVNGLVGPETPVGKTVNGLGEVVGGLLGGGSH